MRGLEALKVRSVLLTSGTLSPLDSFAQELQLEFPLSLENPHVIADSQVYHRSPLDPWDITHLGAPGLFLSPGNHSRALTSIVLRDCTPCRPAQPSP